MLAENLDSVPTVTGPDPGARSVFFGLLLTVFTVLVAMILRPFIAYLLAVLLLAFLLYPLQLRLEPRIGPRPSAVLLVAVAVATTGLVVFLLGLTLPVDASELSTTIERVTARTRFGARLERILGVDVPLGSTLADVPGRIVDLLVGDITNLVVAATDAFLGTVLLLFLLYYLLKDGDRLVEWIERMLPLRSETVAELRDEVSVTTWAVLKGHVFIAVLQGFVAGVGLYLVGIPNVAFWTVVMVFMELFPIVGVAAVLGPAVLYLAFVDRLLAAGFLLVYGLTAVAVIDDYARALVVDRQTSLHSGVVLVGVFGGVYAFGVMGLFYGPIVLGVYRTLVRLFNETYAAES